MKEKTEDEQKEEQNLEEMKSDELIRKDLISIMVISRKDFQPLWSEPFLDPLLRRSKRHLFAHNLQFFNC